MNPGPYAELLRRRLERLRAKAEPFTADQWKAVVAFYSSLCAYGCGRPWEHRDHVVPLAKGGAHAIHNLVPACAACNFKRNANTWEPIRRHPLMGQPVTTEQDR